MLTLLPKICAGLLVWMCCILGVLQIGRVQTSWDHAVCGPWGCGPTTSALAAYHLFWLMLLVPPAAVAAYWISPKPRAWAGFALMMLSLAVAIGVVVWQAITWLPQFEAGETTYVVQRCLFFLVTLIDVPMAQLFAIGLLLWAWPRRRVGSPFAAVQGKSEQAAGGTHGREAETKTPTTDSFDDGQNLVDASRLG